MADFLAGYSIQNWLESCPQGYLEDTDYGHEAGAKEPSVIFESPALLEQAINSTVQLVVGERCALAASSGLINSAPDHPSKRFLATQTLDEARHVEVFTQRLHDLGVEKSKLEDVIKERANPNLVAFAEVLLEKVDQGDFIAGVVGQNIVLEGHGLQRLRDDARRPTSRRTPSSPRRSPARSRTNDGTWASGRIGSAR